MVNEQTKLKLQSVATPWPAEKPKIKPSQVKWFHGAHRNVFNKLCGQHPQGIYLELGTWTGVGSTKFVLDRFPQMSVIGIDHFKGSSEHQRKDEYRPIAENLWEHFCCNLWNYRDRLYPISNNTIDAMKSVAAAGIKPDVIYIDAAHEQEAVYNDLKTALELFPGAIIVGDDYIAPHLHPGVWKAIDQAVKEGLITSQEFKNERRVWYLTRNVK